MKSFLTTAVIVSFTALGLGQSAAQTDTPSPGSIGATSPLGADFGQTLGNSRISAPSQGGINATSPLGADFGQPLGDNSQTTPTPYSDIATPGPCTSGGPGAVALSPFDGSGLSTTSGGLSPTNGFTTSGIGAASATSTPCNSVSSSSGVTGSLNFANSAAATATASGANSSAPVSPVSSGLGKSTPATATTSPNTKGLGVTSLGTGGLGTTGLGTTGLGSLPAQSASTLQTTNSPSSATQAETSCSGDLAALPVNPAVVTARSLGGGVPDLALSLGGSATDAAQRLGGAAGVPAIPVPCPTTSTMP
jgi:hypothetical protein